MQGHWWYDLIDDGTQGDVWVKTLQGDPAKWDHVARDSAV